MKQEDNTKRHYIELDIIRGLLVIWIVGIWHMNSYLTDNWAFSEKILPFLHNVTYSVLATFTFLSGILLGKYRFSALNDILTFYKKRLSRFFFLLLIATISYLVLHWISITQAIQIVTGTNLFFNSPAPTLWFFSMIIYFYLLTPLLRWNYQHPITKIFVSLILFIPVFWIPCDKRLLIYMPFYIAGLNLGVEKILRLCKNKITLTLFVVTSFIQVLLLPPHSSILVSYVITLQGVGLLISIGILISYIHTYIQEKQISRIMSHISYASMFAYLFHRQFFSLSKALYSILFKSNGIPLIAAIVLLVIFFYISFYAQSAYDSLYKKINAK